jgi:ubiquinone/menaquinone biosynthesis C-methylase UbiE
MALGPRKRRLTGQRAEAARLAERERVREIWAKFAPRYDRQIAFFERLLFGGMREWACSRASGQVLEIGVGTGRNLRHYPREARLTGVDISPEMLEIARRRAAALGRDVQLRVADAESLEFPDGSFDTAVSTLTMCSIPDYGVALAEAWRVLRPGGRFVMVEHVRSPASAVRLAQRILDPLTVRFAGDHLLREPLPVLQRLGLQVLVLQRLKWGIVERVVAEKPGGGA